MRSPVFDELVRVYNDRKVCVLGGAGFVGSMLVRQLQQVGAYVTVIDDMSRGMNKIRGANYIPIDITKMALHDYSEMTGRFDYVFNLAAFVAGVDYNMAHNELMYDKNLVLLTAPLNWAAENTRRYMQTSSVCIYPADRQVLSDETDAGKGEPQAANFGYAMAKLEGEEAAFNSDIEHVVVVRPSNIIGPYDYYDDRAHVLPQLVKRAFSIMNQGGDMVVWGRPDVTREFIHSRDAASGMMHALAFGENREAYNIGSNGDTEVTLKYLAEAVIDSIRVDCPIVFDETKGGGDLRRSSAATKLEGLGWRRYLTVREGVEDAVETYARLDR